MSKNKGVYLALVSAFISGVSIFVNKFAVDAIKQPLVFTSVKNSGVTLLILGILIFSGKWKKVKKLDKREFIFLGLIGLVGGSIPFYLFFTGLSTIPAINGAIIQKTLVIWVTLLAVPLLKERLSKVSAIAVLILFAANLLVGGFNGFSYSKGELLVLLATLFWAVEIILAKKILPKVDPDILTAARMGIGAIILLTMSAYMQPMAFKRSLALSPVQWFWLIFTMVTLLGYVTTWYRALKFAPAITVTSILVASTLATNILSALFITHTFNFLMIIQSLFITSGVLILYKADKAKENLLLVKPAV